MRARAWVFLVVTTAVLLGVGAPATAQKSDDDELQPIGGLTFKDEYQLTVVNLDVFVRDSDGNPVTGLEKDDFRVLQDGQVREITNFALYTEEAFVSAPGAALPIVTPPEAAVPPPEAEAEPAREEPELKPVYMVLFVDNENIRPFDRTRVLAQVRGFVTDLMNPFTSVMVVSFGRSLEIEQPFTTDSGEVINALRSLRKAYAARPDREKERQQILRDMQYLRSEVDSGGSTGRNRRQGGRMRETVYESMRTFAEEGVYNLRLTIDALRQVTQILSGLPGRKSLVYVSSGLPMVPGRDLFNEYQAIYQDAASVLPLESRYNQRHQFRSLASSANAQGVHFYTIDASGVQAAAGVSAEYGQAVDPITATIQISNYQESLVYLAEETGGLAIINANDVTNGLRRIKEDLFTYYSIGYPLVSGGGDTVHRIEVELPGHPEYDVRYRRTLVEKSLETKVQDRVMSGLVFDLRENPMDVRVEVDTPMPAAPDSDRWLVPLEVSFPLRSVALIPEGDDYVGRVVLFVAARDRQGKQSDLQRRQHEIRMPAGDYETRQDERYVIDLDMLMEAGSYRVATGLMDQVTRQSSYEVTTTVVGGDS